MMTCLTSAEVMFAGSGEEEEPKKDMVVGYVYEMQLQLL